MGVSDQDKERAGEAEAVTTVPASRTQLAGNDALDLYVRQITRNLTELEEQVIRLREACAEQARLLLKID